ncbi:hypothetical protein BDV26DRAFT_292190 [Aspergillus bertholletiae]|uniref:Zn(2)-C6 fungal-type domain-containing protein n=1 Tax=Aspergillus bertholletiae TaxID=1226010 RepID=A0A5N7B9T4_9EURO|nr:hypothetical protein BDV26DRAFT_292190 [Aspergillus bertholletiae]
MDRSLGPYRFGYPDDGLARYTLGDVLEQYLSCDEYFWWQNLRVGKKVFKFQAFLHTREEEQRKIWKSFRQMRTVNRPMEVAIDLQRPRLGQFLLTWMKESELRQAKNILEEQCDRRYENAIRAIDAELVNKKGEHDVKHGSSWIRRVKCDEQRPNCLRCTSTGRHCDGYPSDLALVQRRTWRPATINSYCIPFKVPGSQADRQLLHYYCYQAAESLSSYTDPTLWTTLVLQRSHHEPVIRNALVTLSALYQDHSSGQLSCYNNDNLPPLSVLQRIAKCHRQLRIYLSSPDAVPEVALTCSVLFYAFEAIIGNTQQAIRHLDLSLTLLQQCRKNNSYMAKPDDIVPHLAVLLANLDIQASIYDPHRGIPRLILTTPSEICGMHNVVPDTLSDVAQSEAVLLKLQNWICRHLSMNASVKHKPPAEIPPEILHERMVLEGQVKRYLTAIDRLYESSEEKVAQRILLLRIQGRMFYGVILQRFPIQGSGDSTSITRSLTVPENWRDTLSEISILLDAAPQYTASRSRPFTLSTQLVGGLLHACLKATHKDTLQIALSLLQHPNLPSRDGLWDAKVVESVVRSRLAQFGAEQDVGERLCTVSTSDELDQIDLAMADQRITSCFQLDICDR